MSVQAIIGALLGVLALGAAPDTATGTWSHGGPEKGGGRLLTERAGHVVRCELECWRGAPSYNSGFLAGQFGVAKNRGIFRSEEKGRVCDLEFLFSSEEVVVRYVNESIHCGFGHAVNANGRYRRVSTKVPTFSPGDSRVQP